MNHKKKRTHIPLDIIRWSNDSRMIMCIETKMEISGNSSRLICKYGEEKIYYSYPFMFTSIIVIVSCILHSNIEVAKLVWGAYINYHIMNHKKKRTHSIRYYKMI